MAPYPPVSTHFVNAAARKTEKGWRLHFQVEQLEKPVPHVAGVFVFTGLGQECLRVELVDVAACGQLQLDPDGDVEVLAAQHPGPVTGEFGLALPLQQGGDDGAKRPTAERNESERRSQPHEVHQHGAVHRMAGQRVTELVAENKQHLVVRSSGRTSPR